MRLGKEYAIYTQIDKQMDLKSYYVQIIFFLNYGSLNSLFSRKSQHSFYYKRHCKTTPISLCSYNFKENFQFLYIIIKHSHNTPYIFSK